MKKIKFLLVLLFLLFLIGCSNEKIPSIQINNLNMIEDIVDFDFSIKDKDNLLTKLSIILYQENNKISELTEEVGNLFNNLTKDASFS